MRTGSAGVSLWLLGALLSGAGLAACGGLASDGGAGSLPGFEPDRDDHPPQTIFDPSCDDYPLVAECQAELPSTDPCEDNPLLAGCGEPDVFSGGGTVGVGRSCEEFPYQPRCNTPDGAGGSGGSNGAFDDLPPIEKAEAVLRQDCGQCHAPGVPTPKTGPDDIRDLDLLMQQGYIEDCSPERSRIIQSMRPLTGVPVPFPAGDIDIVSAGILEGCSPEERQCADDPGRAGCAVVQAEMVLDHRCGGCHGSAARAQLDEGVPFDGMNYIDDFPRLLEEGKIVPCDGASSPLLRRATDAAHPPPQRQGTEPLGYGLSSKDVGVLSTAIDALCPGPAGVGPEADEQRRLEGLLEARCGECHGARAVQQGTLQGGFAGVDSIDALIRAGWLVPCVRDGSPLIARSEEGRLHALDSSVGATLSSDDISALSAFLSLPCAGPR